VVYASTTGESSIIAPDGALIEHSGIWQRAILDARVPLVSYRTLADRVGAWPEYVIIVLTVLALAWAVLLPRRKRAGTATSTRTPEGTRAPEDTETPTGARTVQDTGSLQGTGAPGREGTGTEPPQGAHEPI